MENFELLGGRIINVRRATVMRERNYRIIKCG